MGRTMKYKKYHIYDNPVNMTDPVATINEDGSVTGLRAEGIEKFLLKHGWPEVPPDSIFHWGFCWAEEVKESIDRESQKNGTQPGIPNMELGKDVLLCHIGRSLLIILT
jgi:hypothetical protein